MKTNLPWSKPQEPFVQPHMPKAEQAKIDRCLTCSFSPDVCNKCPHYEGLVKVVDNWLYIHITKEVIRAEREIRQELGRDPRVT